MPLRFLVVGSETPGQRAARRLEVGAASDETYADTLRFIEPEALVDGVSCVDGSSLPDVRGLRAYDAAFFPGSPIAMHADTPEARSAAAFMRQVFAAGIPAFGSCAGVQIAAVAAGGSSKPRNPRMEAAFARGIVATVAGRDHPLLRGRPLTWDAPAMHSDEVSQLPEGAVVLARTKTTPVEAVEIRHGEGIFWGVQYHPELTLGEIAAALRRQADDLIKEGLADTPAAVETYAGRIDALGREPGRRDLAWQLGIDEEITDPVRRTAELRNFIEHLVKRPRKSGPSGDRQAAPDRRLADSKS